VESGAYSPTVCAERTAIAKAVSEGFTEFDAVAVVAFQEEHFTSPCGVCRQTISEFAQHDIKIYMAKDVPDDVLCSSLFELLPHRFVPDSLKKQQQ
jgi:cytidine deaminase